MLLVVLFMVVGTAVVVIIDVVVMFGVVLCLLMLTILRPLLRRKQDPTAGARLQLPEIRAIPKCDERELKHARRKMVGGYTMIGRF